LNSSQVKIWWELNSWDVCKLKVEGWIVANLKARWGQVSGQKLAS